jgi:pimeloyl-ACP methyl ester carboxylesterase
MSLLAGDSAGEQMLAEGARSMESVGRRLAEGDHTGAARQFADEVAFGPGAWDSELPEEVKEVMVNNAPTFLDELQDPGQTVIDENALASLQVPLRLTMGSESPPFFARVIQRLTDVVPDTTVETIEGTGHVPQLTTPERYVEVTLRALAQAA